MTITTSKGIANSEIDDAIRTWAFYGEVVKGLPHRGEGLHDGSMDERTYQWLAVEATIKEFGGRAVAIGIRSHIMEEQLRASLRSIYLNGTAPDQLGPQWPYAVLAVRIFKRKLGAYLAEHPYRRLPAGLEA